MLKERARTRASRAKREDLEDEVSSSSVSGKASLSRARGTSKPLLWIMVAIPLLAVSTCGTREPWALGSVAMLMGLCILLAPPRLSLPRLIFWPLVLAVFLSLGSFLPLSWFGKPAWRSDLESNFNLSLGSFLSPQPLVTLEGWFTLVLFAVWLGYCLTRGFGEKERQFIIRRLVLGFSIVAGVAIFYRYQNWLTPTFWRGEYDLLIYFGPFPNRNHFSALAAVGCLLAFASMYDMWRRKSFQWVLYGLAIVPLFTAMLLNTSRSGLLIFFFGLAVWMFTATLRKGTLQSMAVAASVFMAVAAIFLTQGKDVIKRFTMNGSVLETLTNDGRWAILHDTFKMTEATPVFGIGIGNFEPIFNLTSGLVSNLARVHHPESDWFWLLAEQGVPVFLLAIMLMITITRRFGPWRAREKSGRRDRRLRTAAGTTVLMMVVLGLVDAPLRNIGLVTSAILLAGLAMRPTRQRLLSSLSPRFAQFGGALVCFIMGSLWLLTASGKPLLPGNSAARLYAKEAEALSKRGDQVGALKQIGESLRIKPLEVDYHYARAVYKLQAGYPPQNAMEDFAISRKLESNLSQHCEQEAEAWSKFYPAYSIPVLREAMRRNPARAPQNFRVAITYALANPELRPAVRELATEPKYLLDYLAHFHDPATFETGIEELLDMDPTLSGFNRSQQYHFFRIWYAFGDRAKVVRELEQNSSWRSQGWPILASHKASLGDFKGAYDLALNYLPAPTPLGPRLSEDLSQLKRNFLYNPTDMVRGLEYFQALKSKGQADEAFSVLNQVAELPNTPSLVFYEQALALAKRGDYAKAWDRIYTYFNALNLIQW
jgi:O-antigen ligase